ncbi:MAG TPA: citrate lyase holo-[acyl-carrier protein] synthase [Vicinamibacterales bacterium]|jgi:holo-ACP synthase CitX
MALDLPALRRQLLDAREVRDARIRRHFGTGSTLVFLGTNIPGPDKHLVELDRLMTVWLDGVVAEFADAIVVDRGDDALGPWELIGTRMEPEVAKRRAVALEEALRAGRLLDLDVYAPDGSQVDRRRIGLPPRCCLVCDEPAGECIRAGRHTTAELHAAVCTLLVTP